MLRIIKKIIRLLSKIVKKRNNFTDLNNEFFEFIRKFDILFDDNEEVKKFKNKVLNIFETQQKRLIKTGEIHWFDKSIGLNNDALEIAYMLMNTGDLERTIEFANLMRRTGQKGPKLSKFLELVFSKKNKKNLKVIVNKRDSYEKNIFDSLEKYIINKYSEIEFNKKNTRSEKIKIIENIICAHVRQNTIGEEWLRPILTYYAQLKSVSMFTPLHLADPENVNSINITGFRNYVTNKTVCLVGNSPSLIGKNMGTLIDSYDVVIRFNSFKLEKCDTGIKTNVHACIHLYEFNLDIPVDIRIMVSKDKQLWKTSIHNKVIPGAQKWLGDASLSWPSPDLGLITEKDPFKIPTLGFNMLCLLLYYNVSKKIDLFGFDFYKNGSLRLQQAMSIKHSRAHNSEAERNWVMTNAYEIEDMKITMKD